MLKGIVAAVDGALAGWTMGEKLDQHQRLHAIGIAAGMLLPVLLKRRALHIAAAAALAVAGYAVHEILKQERHKVFAPSIVAAEDRVDTGVPP